MTELLRKLQAVAVWRAYSGFPLFAREGRIPGQTPGSFKR
jgi:hypothetical protein